MLCCFYLQTVDKKGAAWEAGLRPNHLITHINGESTIGLQHIQVMHLLVDKKHSSISLSTVPLDQTSIRKDKRKRMHAMGHRVGKLFRHRSNVKKRPSFLNRLRNKGDRHHPPHYHSLDSPGNSSSSTPSPKLPSTPHRSDSFTDKLRRRVMRSSDRHRKHTTPVSPLARNTSPGPASANPISPGSSPPGSMQNIVITGNTPPNSPPTTITRRPERHSMFVDSQLLVHTKSQSVSELSPALKKSSNSPQTSPLLKRALSPSEIRKKVTRPKRSITLPRAREIQHQKLPKLVSILTRDSFSENVLEVEGEGDEEALEEDVTQL